MVHLQDVASSSGEQPGCDVALGQEEHSYWLPGSPVLNWWGGHLSLTEESLEHAQ